MNDSPSEQTINSFRKRTKKHQEIQTDEQMSMFDQIESDLNRVRLDNLKLQKFLKQAQDNLAINSNNHNNTSSKFMMPSEFKSKYESMVKESLPCAFVSLFDQPKLLVQVIQYSALYISQYVKKVLEQKTQQIAKIIGIQSNGLMSSLLKLYQDNYLTLLEFDEQILPALKQHLKSNINNITQWIDDEDNDDFIDWIKQYWLLMSYVQLSDQELTIGFDQVQYEMVTFTKNEYYNIDGFGKEGMKCLVILPTIMRKQQPFNGLKQSILILPPDFDKLTLDMQLKIEDLTQELKTYNSPKQMTSKKESISELQCQQQQQQQQQQQESEKQLKIEIEKQKQQLQQQSQSQSQQKQQKQLQPYIQDSQFKQPEQEQSKIFFSQRSDQKEVCDEFRIKPHQKQPRKSMLREMRDTLKQLNTFNDQSLRDIGKVIRQNQQKEDSKKQIQQTLQQTRLSGVNNWQKILQSKQQNKENSQMMNQSQNTSFHGFTIQQLIKKIQIDGSKPLIKKGNLDSKFIKSFCQSQQISDRRTRAQSNECKYLKGDDLSISPYRIQKL